MPVPSPLNEAGERAGEDRLVVLPPCLAPQGGRDGRAQGGLLPLEPVLVDRGGGGRGQGGAGCVRVCVCVCVCGKSRLVDKGRARSMRAMPLFSFLFFSPSLSSSSFPFHSDQTLTKKPRDCVRLRQAHAGGLELEAQRSPRRFLFRRRRRRRRQPAQFNRHARGGSSDDGLERLRVRGASAAVEDDWRHGLVRWMSLLSLSFSFRL